MSLFVCGLLMMSIGGWASVLTTDQMSCVADCLKRCQPKDVVFLDIDDTVQTICACMFAVPEGENSSEGTRFIDELKKSRKIPQLDTLLMKWRLCRKAQLVDPSWPALIESCRTRGVSVYGLTQMDTGSSGGMGRAEKWRYRELLGLGIKFTPTWWRKRDVKIWKKDSSSLSDAGLTSSGIFYHGIFMTGALTKGEIVRHFLQYHKPSKVIFVDDRGKHVEDVAKVCQEANIPFQGIIFTGVWHVQRSVVPPSLLSKVFELQKQAFFAGTWIEDEDALLHLSAQEAKP